MMYVSVDGDDIGKKLTRIIYSGTEDEITEFSKYVADFFIDIQETVIEFGGKVIFCAGDSIAYCIDGEKELQYTFEKMKNDRFDVSVGCGNTLQQAHWALNIAKSLGKNQVQYFSDLIEILTMDNSKN